MSQPDLFDVGPRDPLAKKPGQTATAAPLGTGPAGETCGSCRFHQRVGHHDQSYFKCGLVPHLHTHGPGSDIRLKWAACREWKAVDA